MLIVCEENFWCNLNVWLSNISRKYLVVRLNGGGSFENEFKVKCCVIRIKYFLVRNEMC